MLRRLLGFCLIPSLLRCRNRCCSALGLTLPVTSSRSISRRSTTSTARFLADAHNEEAVASSILTSLRSLTPDHNRPPKLNVATDFYDPSTGLHSEGVWHNCMAGIACLQLSQSHSDELVAAERIADSLWKYSWDGTSFRRRAFSGGWDHSVASEEGLVQALYYRESEEHRCVQHGAALIFWSLLVRCGGASSGDGNMREEQQHRIAESFLEEFWDDDTGRWRTVSLAQGGGTTDRKSASAGRAASEVANVKDGGGYYRSVDQAVAALACLTALKVLEGNDGTVASKVDRERCESIVRRTCQDLLADSGFGYGSEDDTVTRAYIGLDRNRNFWHDGWTVLALVCARKYIWPDDAQTGEKRLIALYRRLVRRYGHMVDDDNNNHQSYDGTVWHWARSSKPNTASGNVRYCGDNALLYAITRNLGAVQDELDTCGSAFWDFVEDLRSQNDGKGRLSSVADVYPQVRLHPNTELACLVLWKFDEI